MEIKRLDTGPVFITLFKLGIEGRRGKMRVNIDAIASYEPHTISMIDEGSTSIPCTIISLLGGNSVFVQESVSVIDELIWRAGPVFNIKD
jgi:hypothetical protein